MDSPNIRMSNDNVQFLPNNDHRNYKIFNFSERAPFSRIVCTQRRAIIIVFLFVIFVLAIALIGAYARPGCHKDADKPTAKNNLEISGSKETKKYGDFPWKNIRLPDVVEPLSYDLHMKTDLDNFTFQGMVKITFHILKPSNFFVFHSKDLNISILNLNDSSSGKELQRVKVLQNDDLEQVYILLNEELQPKINWTLWIMFAGNMSTDLHGFYKSSYQTSIGETRWLATTHFEPTEARQAFPCFDEPQFKATFTMTMVRQERYLSLFNTPRLQTVEYSKGWFKDTFGTSVRMSTYLVAFVVCDYGSVAQNTSTGVKVSVYTPEEMLEEADLALQVAVSVLEYLEKFFGIPYPMPKQDLIAIPDFAAGAMENWGLITYRMTALLYDPKESSSFQKEWIAIVVAHELAHQWFGNLVTMQWWNDLWLNEGFATFMEYLGVAHVYPSWKMMDMLVSDAVTNALNADGLSHSHPISVDVIDPADINEIFDEISYEKGCSIIRMLEATISSEVLQQGLQMYLKKHAYGSATTQDLWTALTIAVQARNLSLPVNVGQMMDTWTLQMGYPLVTVQRTGQMVTLTQQRFLHDPKATRSEEFTSPFNYTWYIPVTYITDLDPVPTIVWMKRQSATFKVKPEVKWIKLNVNQTGFYRVDYQIDGWKALIQQLHQDPQVFSAVDRSNLFSDIFALSGTGAVNLTMVLDLSQYLVNETEYVAWSTAAKQLKRIATLLEQKPTYTYYQSYLKNLISPWLSKNKDQLWTNNPGSLQIALMQNLMLDLAVNLNHPAVVPRARQIFNDWMNKNESVAPDFKSFVYSAGLRYGADTDWNFVWQKYKETIVASEQRLLLQALTSTTDALQINRFLHLTLDESQVRRGETVSVIGGIASTAAGQALAWRFIKQNWPELEDRYKYGSFDMTNLIKESASFFSTQYDYDEVKAFYDQHEIESGKRAVSQTLENIQTNMDWLKQNEMDCINWLKAHRH